MRVKSRIEVVAACLLVAAGAARAGTVEYTTVSCDGFILGYSGQAQQKTCATAEESFGLAVTKRSQIEVTDRLFYLVANYHTGGYRAYFPTHTPRQLLGWSKSFSQLSNWQPLPDTEGFSVATFSATLDGKAVSCAIFVRYAGTTTSHAEYPSGPGYKTVTEGYYCPSEGFGAGTSGGSALLDDALRKLQLPSP